MAGRLYAGIAELGVVTQGFQAQAADRPDLLLGADLEMAERKRMVKPFQVQMDIQAHLKLVWR